MNSTRLRRSVPPALQVKENELEGINPEFSLEITKIRKFAEPELNEEFFKMAFPAGNVKTAEEFEAFVDARNFEAELRRESDYLFTLQLRDFLLKKAGLTMPVEFLKRWLYVINEGKFSKEEIEGFRRFRKTVHLELSPEILHQDRGISVS